MNADRGSVYIGRPAGRRRPAFEGGTLVAHTLTGSHDPQGIWTRVTGWKSQWSIRTSSRRLSAHRVCRDVSRCLCRAAQCSGFN